MFALRLIMTIGLASSLLLVGCGRQTAQGVRIPDHQIPSHSRTDAEQNPIIEVGGDRASFTADLSEADLAAYTTVAQDMSYQVTFGAFSHRAQLPPFTNGRTRIAVPGMPIGQPAVLAISLFDASGTKVLAGQSEGPITLSAGTNTHQVTVWPVNDNGGGGQAPGTGGSLDLDLQWGGSTPPGAHPNPGANPDPSTPMPGPSLEGEDLGDWSDEGNSDWIIEELD